MMEQQSLFDADVYLIAEPTPVAAPPSLLALAIVGHVRLMQYTARAQREARELLAA